MAHSSRKMLNILAFCTLVATSRGSLILSLADSLEDSGDSGSESVESTDSASTLFSVHGVKLPSHDAAASAGTPATPAADTEEGIVPRFGGGGNAFTSAPGNNVQRTTEIPSTTSELAQTVTRDRSKSPIFNIWEYAKIAGPVHVRTGLGPNDFQQTLTSGLNRCEWAIISCCQNPERTRRNSCFDALHCGGAWFENPCADRLQMAVYGKLLEVGSF